MLKYYSISHNIQRTLDGDDKLRDDWEYSCTSFCKQILGALHSEKLIWVLFFAKPIEEEWQVMMVVDALKINLGKYVYINVYKKRDIN